MTARTLVETTADDLERTAYEHGGDIIRDTAADRMYLRIGATTYTAPIAPAEEVRRG